jgi:nicotinate-nucleotide pyrophosphorylase (carboxylating)
MMGMWSRLTRQLIEIACDEDLGEAGDITSALLPDPAGTISADVVPRQAGVVSGLALGPAICAVFAKRLGRALQFAAAERGGRSVQDGDPAVPGEAVARVRGAQDAVFAAERTLLNFLGRMSGVATLTQRYVAAAQRVNPDVKVLDTRKTIPGWRELDKYAVRTGGGRNHRVGLYDAVLLKDNHLAGLNAAELEETLVELLGTWPSVAPPDVGGAATADEARPAPRFVEVEVDSLDQLATVCKVPGIDIVLLDNFTPEQLRAAVRYRDALSLRGKLALEASGGVTLERIADIAATGVDRISIGALTHAAEGLDLGLDVVTAGE